MVEVKALHGGELNLGRAGALAGVAWREVRRVCQGCWCWQRRSSFFFSRLGGADGRELEGGVGSGSARGIA